MNVGFSATLAILMGTLIPVLGVVRNWTMNESDPAAFFANLLTGGLLLFGAVKTWKRAHTGQRFLSAAWGLTLGLMYSNLMLFLKAVPSSIIRPEATIPEEASVAATIIGGLIALVGLITSLRSTRPQ